jgi:hypothetical protein
LLALGVLREVLIPLKLYCLELLNSSKLSFIQGFALALFLFTIALTVIKMEWRVAAAMLGYCGINHY